MHTIYLLLAAGANIGVGTIAANSLVSGAVKVSGAGPS